MPQENTDIQIRSEEVREILTAVPTWMIRWGNTLFLGLIVGLLGITWFVKYPDIIASEAMVTTQQPPQKEYAKSDGKLKNLLVADNQKVKAKMPLAIIENTANFGDVFFLKSIIDTIKVNSRLFKFPLEDIPVLFLGDIDTDFALFENSYLQYQLNKQLRPYASESLANSISITELQTRIRTLHSQKRLNQSEIDFQKSDLERQKVLFEEELISLQDYERTQTSYLQAERNFANFDASISQLREAISNANKVSIGNSINKTKEEISLLKNVIQSFNQLKRSIKDWEARYVLMADIDGTVSFANFWSENQAVSQGDLVFSIIPENNTAFVAKLKTTPQNSGKIHIGQTVNINLENYPNSEFGSLQGEIKSISLLTNEDGFYLIEASLPQQLITSYNKRIDFKQEMRGTAEIITEDLRLIERFFYQLKNVLK